jgi:histidine triad (HIT) family protein
VFLPDYPATCWWSPVITSRTSGHCRRARARNLASEVVLRVAGAARNALQPEGLNVIQSNGAAATQTDYHLHVHVVPRWATDDM